MSKQSYSGLSRSGSGSRASVLRGGGALNVMLGKFKRRD